MSFWQWFGRPAGRAPGGPIKPADPTAGFNDDDLQSAALDYVHGACFSRESWCGGTINLCDQSDRHIADLRTKYADIEPRRLRRAIMSWLDYYQQENDKNRRDVESQASRRSFDRYKESEDVRLRRVAELRERIMRASAGAKGEQ